MTAQSSRRFAIGVQSFPVMRQGGFVYVDKMHHVWQLSNCFGNYILLSRPRRFGKSLLCSTFKAYFEGRRELFEDLRIAEMDSAWRSHAVVLHTKDTTYVMELKLDGRGTVDDALQQIDSRN